MPSDHIHDWQCVICGVQHPEQATETPDTTGLIEVRALVEGLMPSYPYTGASVRRGVLNQVLGIIDRALAPESSNAKEGEA